MRLENLLRGMTIPGNVPNKRKNTMTKHLSKDEKALFVIQNLVGEIVRLNKVIARAKVSVDINNRRQMISIESSPIPPSFNSPPPPHAPAHPPPPTYRFPTISTFPLNILSIFKILPDTFAHPKPKTKYISKT